MSFIRKIYIIRVLRIMQVNEYIYLAAGYCHIWSPPVLQGLTLGHALC